MSVSRPIRATIDTAALTHNLGVARHFAPHSRLWSVVKANAYGHGMWRAVEALRHEADGFAVLELENAIALREAGITQPILLLEGIFQNRDARLLFEHRLTAVVHCFDQLLAVIAAAPLNAAPALYIKINSGMNRLGFVAADLRQVRQLLTKLPQAEITYMTHFADADDERGVHWQTQRFQAMLENWEGPLSLGNSAAILRHPLAHGDWARPGIMLYGASPFMDQSAESFGLQPVMTLESRLIATQPLVAGERVGYGGSFTADRPMRIGIVACGYADGYPRNAPTGTPIAVCGQRTRTVGRVSMDMLACDISDISVATIGAPVTLWGRGEGGTVAADAVAAAADTIAYELFCGLAPRVQVRVVSGSGAR